MDPILWNKNKKVKRAWLKFTLNHKFSKEKFSTVHESIYKDIKSKLLAVPILWCANISKRFYLTSDFSSIGLGFALCQPNDSKEALTAM